MRKWIAVMVSLCVLLCAASAAQATGVTLRTFTPFADVDFAAQGYMDMITSWEQETGNVVEDYSGAMDEMWMDNLRSMLADGAVDVVVLPVGSGLSVQELVTVGELASSSDCGAKKFSSMKEADGSLLLAPVRLYWEALYVNTDVLSRYGLGVPSTFEDLLAACAVLAQNGVQPIANALCEWNEIVLDCAALAGAPAEQYGQQARVTATPKAGVPTSSVRLCPSLAGILMTTTLSQRASSTICASPSASKRIAASPARNLLSASASVMFHGSLPNAPTRTSVSSTSFAPSSDACWPYCSAGAPASAAQSSTISFHSVSYTHLTLPTSLSV